jgi:hypothetical protein
MKTRGLALLGLLSFVAAGCGQTSRGVSSPSTSPVAVASTAGTAPAVPGLCAGDPEAARTVAIYRGVLTDSAAPIEALGTPSKLYVSSRWLDDSYAHAGAREGVLSEAVQRCLAAGVTGLPPIVMVDGPEDAAIATVSTQGIREFAGGAKYVVFGDVSPGADATTWVTVDSGGGNVSGGKCVVHLKGDEVVSLTVQGQWIS